MNTLLEDLYRGNIVPAEVLHPRTDEQQRKHDQFARDYDAFEETLRALDPSLPQTFDSLLELNDRLNFFETCQTFQDGFCLGVQLMQAVSRWSAPWDRPTAR